MTSRYDPSAHILPVDIDHPSDGVLDQREVTVQGYETTVPFSVQSMAAGLDVAWLSPANKLGLFTKTPNTGDDEIHIVIGVQGEVRVRAYDYEAHIPLYYSWTNVVTDTMAVRYVPDEQGFLRFTSFGGGRRITPDRLYDFNAGFLGVPKGAARRRSFDLEKLRDLCFGRFLDGLYMIRFGNVAAKEYESIDHALFKSREYINPKVDRIKEIRDDRSVLVESFESDVIVRSNSLTESLRVRFTIHGGNGAIHLKFPRIVFKSQYKTLEEQSRVFYELVDETVRVILDVDYYANRPRTLNELKLCDDFAAFVDIYDYKRALLNVETRARYFDSIDLRGDDRDWLPHLRALDELSATEAFRTDLVPLIEALVTRDPQQGLVFLVRCHDKSLKNLGPLVAGVLFDRVHALPNDLRTHAVEALIAWAVENDEAWDVDVERGELRVRSLDLPMESVSIENLPKLLWKLIGVLHARLLGASPDADVGPDMRKLAWCIDAARGLPPNEPSLHAALRLIAQNRVPTTLAGARVVLKEAVSTWLALDDAMLAQFGLPNWPSLSIVRAPDGVFVENTGVGTAIGLAVEACDDCEQATLGDLVPGARAGLRQVPTGDSLAMRFEKYGQQHRLVTSVGAAAGPAVDSPAIISRQRRIEAAEFRKKIDPTGRVVGNSPAILQMFEGMAHANATPGFAHVLLLGETGVGKTYVAQLLHDASRRKGKRFIDHNAGQSGGDPNIQRGEWVGFGADSGIANIPTKSGKKGILEDAQGGTLFVDELASLSPELQTVFLSVLEGRPVDKVGRGRYTPDVRCVFATNADVDQLVAAGTLRRDFVARVGLRITIPPLRARRGDILPLARKFAEDNDVTFGESCKLAMLQYDWPQNVRELKLKVAAAVASNLLFGKASLAPDHLGLPADLVRKVGGIAPDVCSEQLWRLADQIATAEGFDINAGRQKRAAEILGVQEPQACKKYSEYHLQPDQAVPAKLSSVV